MRKENFIDLRIKPLIPQIKTKINIDMPIRARKVGYEFTG